jgi:hypothetical protein
VGVFQDLLQILTPKNLLIDGEPSTLFSCMHKKVTARCDFLLHTWKTHETFVTVFIHAQKSYSAL